MSAAGPHALAGQRRERLARRVRRAGLSAILVTSRPNVTYLTGFTGEATYLLVMPTGTVVLSDSRFALQLAEECPDLPAEIRTTRTTLTAWTERAIKRLRLARVGVDVDSVSKSLFDALQAACPRTEFVATPGWVEEQRAIKDRHELATIRRAVHLAERAFEVMRAELRADQTERHVAFHLEHQIRLFGGERCSFEPIVAVGDRAALPHAVPGERAIGSAGLLLVDWGARVDGYASDLTRVLATTKISPKLRRVYDVVRTAQRTAISQIRPGAVLRNIDRAARAVIERAGWGKRFGHGLGHGLGLEIHEAPWLSPASEATLAAGMVVTVEPGVYLPRWGGVRIEDDVLVTNDGHEVLSRLTSELDASLVQLD